MANKELTKTEIKDIIKSELEKQVEKLVKKELKGKVSERLIIQVVKNAMSSLYKTLWIRRATWLSGVENMEN